MAEGGHQYTAAKYMPIAQGVVITTHVMLLLTKGTLARFY